MTYAISHGKQLQKQRIVDITATRGIIMCESASPNNLIDEILGSEHFIQNGLRVVTHMPIQVDVDAAGFG